MPVASSPKTYPCDVCGVALQTKWALDNHVRIFHDECSVPRPGTEITFRCAACGAAFEHRSDLIAHMEGSGHGSPHARHDVGAGGRRGQRGAARRRS